jgi:polyisoprenoid-binding protein YceI
MEMSQVMSRTKWTLDPSHSHVGFKVKYLMVTNVRGTFKNYDANIVTARADFLDAEIDLSFFPASINTGDFTRDTHLRSPDFFDTEKFKVIDFKGIEFERINESEYVLYGNLTIKGVTKLIRLDVEFNGIAKDLWGATRAGFVITGKISRSDFDLTWNKALETGDLLVGDEVDIKCDIQLIQKGEFNI